MGTSRRSLERFAVLFLLAAVVLAAVPAPALAQSESGAAGTIVVEEGETVDSIDAVAGTVIVRGTVTGDVNGLAGNVYVHGEVGGDLSVAAGNLEITGAVVGDVAAGAGNIVLAEEATIGGDLQAGAGNVRIDGTVDGDATVGAETIALGENAAIGGNLRYDGDLEGDTGVVAGDVTRDRTLGPQIAPSFQPLGSALFAVYALVTNLLLGAALLGLFPRFSAAVADRVATDPLRSGLTGAGVLVGVPLLLTALAITIVGLPLGLVGALLFALLAWVAVVYGRFAVAAWLLSRVDVTNRWLALVVGLAGAAALVRLPYVGGLSNLVLFLLGLGALSLALYGQVRDRRSAPTAPRAEGGTYE